MIYDLNITGCELCGIQDERDLHMLSDPDEEYHSPLNQVRREADWAWRDEIAKYLPSIHIMSFAGPASTIKWLFEQVRLRSDEQS